MSSPKIHGLVSRWPKDHLVLCHTAGNLIHILTCSWAVPAAQVTWNRRNQSVLGVRWVTHKFLPVKFSYPDARMQSRRTPKPNEPNIISVIMQNTKPDTSRIGNWWQSSNTRLVPLTLMSTASLIFRSNLMRAATWKTIETRDLRISRSITDKPSSGSDTSPFIGTNFWSRSELWFFKCSNIYKIRRIDFN